MEEVVYRRYKRLLAEGASLPQLIIVDGGKGQLSSGLKSLDLLGLRGKIAIIGIAKRLEEIYYPGDPIPMYLDKKSETLKITQYLRNEAHRFGITFHRNKRSKAAIKSELEQIPDIGKQTITNLLRKFKSTKRVKEATFEESPSILSSSKKMKKRAFLILFLFTSLLFSQKKQPTVGLVLSGGGAKGFAHISVLKELDRTGVQVAYIGGTSMGAIVGGLYAIGYSGEQIEKIIKETDFIKLLRDKLPRSTSPFFEKEYGEKTAISLPVNKGKIGLPKAVSRGQNVLSLLQELTSSIENNADFSKFQIPFFCIATDVETGNEIVLEKGNLALSLRASGSFPTLLNPVELQGKLLIDGGVANNFPVDIMRKKGVDIIIGVDVQGRLYEKEKLTSVVSILNQIVSYQMYNKRNIDKESVTVYIQPEIANYNVVSFDKKNEIIKKGNEAALKFTEVFKKIAAQQTTKIEKVVLEIDTKKVKISSIRISGLKRHTRSYVLGKLNLIAGDSVSRNEITKKIYLLSATKNFDRIQYKINKLSNNTNEIDFSLIEAKKIPSLQLGLHYDLLYESAIMAKYNQEDVLVHNDVLSLDLILGDRLRYNLNYFVDNGLYLSYGFRSRFNYFSANSKFNNAIPGISDLNRINLKYSDFSHQFFVQTTFDRKFALGLGLEHKSIKITTETILINNDETIFDDSNYFGVFGYLKLDTYDQKYFVKKGYFADLGFKWYLNSSDYNTNFRSFIQAKGTLGFATTFFDTLTFQNTNAAGLTLDSPASNVFDFYVGGYNQNYINTFISLYGYEFAELSGNSFLKSEFLFRYQFIDKNYISFIANYARLDDNVLGDVDFFKDIMSGYAIGYSVDSFLGPIELKYSWSPETKQRAILFNLGYWF
jgi:NTE family protein